MWNWLSTLLGASVIQADWEISRRQNGFQVVLKRRNYTCDEVIKVIRDVTTIQGTMTKECHAKSLRDPNCYLRKAD